MSSPAKVGKGAASAVPIKAITRRVSAAEVDSSLLRSEITLARPHLQIFLQRGNFNGTIPPVRIKVCRPVGNYILAAKLIFNRGERMRHIFHLERKEGTSAGRCRQLFQNFVAAQNQPAVLRRNCVD